MDRKITDKEKKVIELLLVNNIKFDQSDLAVFMSVFEAGENFENPFQKVYDIVNDSCMKIDARFNTGDYKMIFESKNTIERTSKYYGKKYEVIRP